MPSLMVGTTPTRLVLDGAGTGAYEASDMVLKLANMSATVTIFEGPTNKVTATAGPHAGTPLFPQEKYERPSLIIGQGYDLWYVIEAGDPVELRWNMT